MLSYLYISARNVAASGLFYDAVLSPAGYLQVIAGDQIFFYPPTGGVTLCISRPWNGGEAVAGNGGMPAIQVPSRRCVNAIYTAGLRTGGSDAGRPGARARQNRIFYMAYLRDPAGNKIAFFCNTAPEGEGPV
ncbi:VOC family protein [Pantoea agglomerans]|uniref:Glyoxalase family protein n=1 Tax=Enterobacter agglomerans TaxID=549 RepID=A0AAN2K827_ENTAG|nr:VOC family protein [Pantoea agglomerans]CAH6385258.1 Glyoxalase family protein [Pantoea agglomerans]